MTDIQGAGTGGQSGGGNTGGERVYTISNASDEFYHEALLKELHQADNLLVSHSTLSVTITGAAIAFAATQLQNRLQNRFVLYWVAVFGVICAVEWLFIILRGEEMHDEATKKIETVSQRLLIDTNRPQKKANGFKIFKVFTFAILLMWFIFVISVWKGWLLERSNSASDVSASDVYERVSEDMQKILHNNGLVLNVTSMNWDNQTHSYTLHLSTVDKSQEKLMVIYDAVNGRITKWEKQ